MSPTVVSAMSGSSGYRSPVVEAPVRVPAAGPLLRDEPAESWREHVARLGERPRATARRAEDLLERLDRAALSGHGGGHFPVARKWRTVRRCGGGGTVVANGAESEPLSAKDGVLLTRRPHLVLDGLQLAIDAVGAQRGVLWLHDTATAARGAVLAAVAERRAAGVFECPVQVVTTPAHYLAGESSAVLHALEGGPALPQFRARPAAEQGLAGRPTLVHNVETLVRVALLARGADDAAAASLVTVLLGDARVVLDVEPAASFPEVLARAGLDVAPSAVLVGGFGGRWLAWRDAAACLVAPHALRSQGVSLGAGILAPLPPGACGLDETARVAGYLAASSARQCGPCRFGLPTMAGLVRRLAAGEAGTSEVVRLRRHGREIRGRGACSHPDGAVSLVASALDVFADDVTAHLTGGCLGEARGILPIPHEVAS